MIKDHNFEIARLIPNPKMSTEELGQIFIQNNGVRMDQNEEHLKHSHEFFQVMTYNVHMWEGIIMGKPLDPDDSFKKIFDVIIKVSPDLLCLQEVIYIDRYMQKIYQVGYVLVVSCVINPSYRKNQLYMTMILCKHDLREQLVKYSKVDRNFAPIC
jgi:endonuclease/exonuclease/phosphatase family metal-dependent hydrolase